MRIGRDVSAGGSRAFSPGGRNPSKSGLPRERRDLGLFGDKTIFLPPASLFLGNDWWSGECRGDVGAVGSGSWGPVSRGGPVKLERGSAALKYPRGGKIPLWTSGSYGAVRRLRKVMLCCRRLRSPARRCRHGARQWLAEAHCVCALRPGVCLQCPHTGQLPAHCAMTGHPRTRAAETQRSRAAGQPCAMQHLNYRGMNYEAAITNPPILHLFHLPNRRHAIGDCQAGNAIRPSSPTQVAPSETLPDMERRHRACPRTPPGIWRPDEEDRQARTGRSSVSSPSWARRRQTSLLSPVYGSNYWVPSAHSLDVPGCGPPRAPHGYRPRP